MMRYFFRFCLLTGALASPAAAATLSGQPGACESKGSRGTSNATTLEAPPTASVPARTIAARDRQNVIKSSLSKPTASAKPWLVITPRLPEAPDGTLLERRAGVAGVSMPMTGYAQMSRSSGGYGQAARTAIGFGSAVAYGSQTALIPVGGANGCLARVTAYWACEGDYYTRHGIASTGVRLHDGHCAVDPNIIPYGSVVNVAGVGSFLAVDTGSAVVSRTAARQGGHNRAERNAIVVDLFFANRSAGERFASRDAKWTAVNWWTPASTASQARVARSLFAEEDWTKIQGKQL